MFLYFNVIYLRWKLNRYDKNIKIKRLQDIRDEQATLVNGYHENYGKPFDVNQ